MKIVIVREIKKEMQCHQNVHSLYADLCSKELLF